MSEEQKKPEIPVSHQKRTALLRYMAVLFAVAFALVLLSYLIQVRNSQTTITQLNATSASALQNAERLQDTNRELTEENKRLNQELDNALMASLEYQEGAEANEKAAWTEGQSDGAAKAQKAYDLLLQAMEAGRDQEALGKALTELEPLKDKLSPEALKKYEALLQQYNALMGKE